MKSKWCEKIKGGWYKVIDVLNSTGFGKKWFLNWVLDKNRPGEQNSNFQAMSTTKRNDGNDSIE